MKLPFLKRGVTLALMRISFLQFIFAVFLIHVSWAENGMAQELLNRRISINADADPLERVIGKLEKLSGTHFIYSREIVDSERKVTYAANNKKLSEILEGILSPLHLKYHVYGNQIIIRKNNAPGQTGAISTQHDDSQPAPDKIIIGSVTDEKGEPLPGVSILVKGSQKGTSTDYDGNYQIEMQPGDDILVVSYVGYITQEISIGNTTQLNITLQPDIKSLEEVVVIGYGSVSKKDLTGAVGSVNASKINQVPVTNVAQALQGRISGVLVTNNSWKPGASPSVLIRGKRSISASSDPLYVVDGIPMSGGMNEISPADIESMDVLKDASATAIYGARGSNGVIIITTKKGKAGATQVDYNSYYGLQTTLNRLPYMNGAEFAETVRESYRATGKYKSSTPSWEEDQTIGTFRNDPYTLESIKMAYDENGNYDPSRVRSNSQWWEAVQRTGMITDHQLSIRGGSEKTKFLIGGTYNRNKGIMKDEDYKRFSMRVNLDHQLNNFIKIGGQTQFSHSVTERGADLNNNWRVIPIGRFYDDNDNLLLRVSGTDDQYWNPLTRLADGAVSKPLKNNRFFGSYYGEITLPVDGLRFRTNLGIDFISTQDYDFQSGIARSGRTNYAKNATADQFMYTWENLIFYDKQLGDHNLGVTLLQSIQQNLNESNGIPVENIPSDALLYYNVGAGLIPGTLVSNKQQWNIASFMGRVNYGFKNKYLLTASLRYDGASRLAAGHKWVQFPAMAFAWRLSEEDFLRNIKSISDLKLRVGYGTTASSEVSPYQTKGTLSTYYYNYGSSLQIGYAPSTLPTPNLTWETTGQWNAGVDFGLLNNRITGSVDVYLQNTHDLLIDRQLPVVSGFSVIKSNVGRTRNKGIEFSMNTVNVETGHFRWSTDWMVYTNKEQIVELYNGKDDDTGNKWFIGQPINVTYDYKKTGIWQNTPEDLAEMAKFNENGSNFTPGSIRLYDNGDYVINSDDRVIQGQARPKLIGSLVNTFEYKGFDLSLFLYGSYGSMIENNIEYLNQAHRNSNVKVNYWTPDNPSHDAPRPVEGIDNLNYIQTMRYENADFLRVRSLSLGYTLPKDVLNKLTISRCRIYATAQNPLIWTKYTGVDPEGAQGYAAPSVRTWVLGLNLSF